MAPGEPRMDRKEKVKEVKFKDIEEFDSDKDISSEEDDEGFPWWQGWLYLILFQAFIGSLFLLGYLLK